MDSAQSEKARGKPKKYILKAETGHINITPYAMAKISEAFYKTSKNYDSRDTLTVNYFLYCISIETGLKAAILSRNNSKNMKEYLKKEIDHDILKLIIKFKEVFKNQKIIDSTDLDSISKINKYYKNKGLEYFTSDVICAFAHGCKDFPELSAIENISSSIVCFLEENEFFRNT